MNSSTQSTKDKTSEDVEIKKLKKKLKKTENELKSLEMKFENLFEMTNDAIFWADLETEKFILVNKRASQMFGFSLEEIYKKHASDLIAREEIEDSKKRLEELKKGKILPIYERIFIAKDGTTIPCEVNLSIVQDPVSKKPMIQSILRDISERKRYEDSINRDRNASQLLAEAAIREKHVSNLCQKILIGITKTFNFEAGLFRFFDSKEDLLINIASYNIKKQREKIEDEIPLKSRKYVESIVGKKKKSIITTKIDELAIGVSAKKNLESLEIKSLISLPILNSKNNLLGVFQLTSTKRLELSVGDKIYFETLSKLLATSIERILAEEALFMAYNERKELDRIIFLSPAIVFLWKNAPGWPVEFVSENLKLFGYSPEELYSGKIVFSDIIHPDDLKRVAKEVQELSEDKKRMEFIQEYRIITKSGDARWIVDYTTIRRDEKGKITHYHGILLDNTEFKQMESYLKSERRAFQIIAEASATANSVSELCEQILDDLTIALDFEIGLIMLYNKENRILSPIASTKAKETTPVPYTSHSVDDKSYINSLVGRTRKAIFAPDITKLNIEESVLVHLKKKKLNSLITWPILKSNNELIGVLQLASSNPKEIPEEYKIVFNTLAGTLANVIERRIAEEALKKLNDELELRVKERTQQLSEVNRELESFSYTISHDLKSPLRSIKGFSDALYEDYRNILDTKGLDYLKRIENSAIKMENQINEILELSMISSIELNVTEVDLSKISIEIVNELRNQEPLRDVEVIIEDDLKAKGDFTLIKTIMSNLITNAWKFTNKTPRAKILIGKKEMSEKTVFFVQDNGIGFNMEYSDKLFTIFQRLHTEKDFEGTGVGLTIVNRIVQRHNGKIWAEGRENKGATFYFHF